MLLYVLLLKQNIMQLYRDGVVAEEATTPLFFVLKAIGLLAHHLLRQYKIKNYGKQEHYSHAVFGKYGAHDFGEYGKHSGGLGEAKAYTERQTDNDHVAL